MLTKRKASCFIDALDLALGAPADYVAEAYQALVPDHDPDVDGYHPSVVNMVLLERFGIGITEIDLRPVGDNGEELAAGITDVVAGWFKRPGFKCVVTGINSKGTPHANAFCNGRFIDPVGPTHLEQPSVQLVSVWLMDLQPLLPVAEAATDVGGDA